MKQIPLTKGQLAIVDDEDFDYLNQWKWNINQNGYAVRSQHIRLGTNHYASKTIRMHRLINQTPFGYVTDHINRNKLDNRRCNLRTVDKSLNGLNRDKSKNNTSGYRGVYWDIWSNKWKAELKYQGRKISLGRFLNLQDAVNSRLAGEQLYGI